MLKLTAILLIDWAFPKNISILFQDGIVVQVALHPYTPTNLKSLQ